VRAGATVFAQGDPGDAFYVVDEGGVDVVESGRVVATLARGGYFGEIALLRDVPRTATVVAHADTRLLRLDREPFLATVTGNATSSRNADAIVTDRLGFRPGFASL
jgi:CRP-like cAMP-binding protein